MEVFQSPTCAYEKVSQIGQGTYGRVYLCRKQGTEEQYAVKMLKMTKEEMQQLLPNYTREVSTMKTLRHRHLVSFVEEFELQDRVYLVTQYCKEGDLVKYLKGRSLSEAEVLRMVGEMLEGLCFIHSQGYMHRDMKPDNIFLGEGRTVKIGDYGMSKKSEVSMDHTSQVGTPLYSSPEILQGRGKYTAKTDIFSTGLIVYYMLFGFAMFREAVNIDSLKDLHVKYLRGQNRKKKLATLKCSDFFKELLGKMLVLQEAERPSIFQIMEFFIENSGVNPSNNLMKSVKCSESDLLDEVEFYFQTFTQELKQLQNRYLQLIKPINDPGKWSLSNLDRYVLLYILLGLFQVESNKLLTRYSSEYYCMGDRMINWRSPAAKNFLLVRSKFFAIYNDYCNQLNSSFVELARTLVKVAVRTDGKWFEDVMMSAIAFRDNNKIEHPEHYKHQLADYLKCKRIKQIDYSLTEELRALVK